MDGKPKIIAPARLRRARQAMTNDQYPITNIHLKKEKQMGETTPVRQGRRV
jgi:hypothetical protein